MDRRNDRSRKTVVEGGCPHNQLPPQKIPSYAKLSHFLYPKHCTPNHNTSCSNPYPFKLFSAGVPFAGGSENLVCTYTFCR